MAYKSLLRAADLRPGIDQRQVGFHEILEMEHEFKDQFILYQSNGRLPERERAPKPPEIPLEELHRRRLEQIERETYQRAFEAGEQAGLDMGRQKMEIPLARLEHLVRQLDGLPSRILAQVAASSEHLMVEMALALTHTLLGYELEVNPEAIVARVRQVVAQARGRDALVLRLTPRDAEALDELPEFQHIRIESDSTLAPGTIRLETDFGGIEDHLAEQVQKIDESIRDYLHSRQEAAAAISRPLPEYGQALDPYIDHDES